MSSSNYKFATVGSNLGSVQICKGGDFDDLEEILAGDKEEWEGQDCYTEPANKKHKI